MVLSEYGPEYITKDDVPFKKSSSGVYQQGTYTIERKVDCQQYLGTPEWGLCMGGFQDEYKEDKYLYKDKYGNFRQYDTNGRLMSYGIRYGTIASLDSNNNLTKSVDAAGRQTKITYNESNDPIAVVDSTGIGHFFEYDYDKNKKEYYA